MSESDEVGAATEARFLAALTERTERTPDWFVGIKKAAPIWDVRAVDFFLYFQPLKGKKIVKVPVQIKTSDFGAEMFQKKQSPIRKANILLFVVRGEALDNEVRHMTYLALDKLRRKGASFEKFLAEQIQQKLSPPAQKQLDEQILNKKKRKRARH